MLSFNGVCIGVKFLSELSVAIRLLLAVFVRQRD